MSEYSHENKSLSSLSHESALRAIGAVPMDAEAAKRVAKDFSKALGIDDPNTIKVLGERLVGFTPYQVLFSFPFVSDMLKTLSKNDSSKKGPLKLISELKSKELKDKENEQGSQDKKENNRNNIDRSGI